MHSNSHVGISLAAMTHLAAAVPNLTYACDTHYPWQSEELLVGGRFTFEDGALPVPTAPGLGIELDRAALAALHENYLHCGLTRRDDTGRDAEGATRLDFPTDSLVTTRLLSPLVWATCWMVRA